MGGRYMPATIAAWNHVVRKPWVAGLREEKPAAN